ARRRGRGRDSGFEPALELRPGVARLGRIRSGARSLRARADACAPADAGLVAACRRSEGADARVSRPVRSRTAGTCGERAGRTNAATGNRPVAHGANHACAGSGPDGRIVTQPDDRGAAPARAPARALAHAGDEPGT